MLPIIGKQDAAQFDLILTYLEVGDPSIKFVQEFFRKYEIKPEEFLAYLKKFGKEALKYELTKVGLIKKG